MVEKFYFKSKNFYQKASQIAIFVLILIGKAFNLTFSYLTEGKTRPSFKIPQKLNLQKKNIYYVMIGSQIEVTSFNQHTFSSQIRILLSGFIFSSQVGSGSIQYLPRSQILLQQFVRVFRSGITLENCVRIKVIEKKG